MTLDLSRMKALHAAATQGDYEYAGYFPDDEWELSPIISKVQGEQTEFYGTEQDLRLIEALHNAATELIARAELLEWLIREMRMLPEVEYGDAGVVVLYDEYIAPWMDAIEKRYRALEATDGKD